MSNISPDTLGRFLSGEATTDDKAAVSGWAKEAADNADELFAMERMADAVAAQGMSRERVAHAEKRLFDMIAAEERPRARRVWLRYAAAIVGVVIMVAAGWAGADAWQRHAESMAMAVAQAPADSNMIVSLSDGTRVWLRKGSSLRYPKEFDGRDTREVTLDGEAFFEVSENPHHPFTVRSSDLDVTVLGTVFNMNSGRDGGDAEVSLAKGRVRASATGDGGSIVLRPGQKATVDRQTGFLQVSEADAYADGLWHEHKTPFRNANLKYIAKQLETMFGVKVILHDGLDMTRRYNGVIDERESVDSVLNLLGNALPITYKIKDGNVHLYPN